jgi:hypothetical protein
MRKFFRELISDNNNINEQAFVGVVSFFAMIAVLLVDVITGAYGKELVIKEFIYNGFLLMTISAFGIKVAGSIFSKKENKPTNNSDDSKPEELG